MKDRATTPAVTGIAVAQNMVWLWFVSRISVVFIPMKLETNDLIGHAMMEVVSWVFRKTRGCLVRVMRWLTEEGRRA